MEKEKKAFVNWVKKHKKELITAGVSVTIIITVILGIKNRKVLERKWASLKKLVEKNPQDISEIKVAPISKIAPIQDIVIDRTVSIARTPHDVRGHIRNLPEGRKASADKIVRYNLKPGQTWVDSYRTGRLGA